MSVMHPSLLAEIETFLSDSGMGESYFGKVAANNSELVSRLRSGKRVWPETEARVLAFIRVRRQMARLQSRGREARAPQGDAA